MSIKECIFEIKQMLSIYLTLMLPIFVVFAMGYFSGTPLPKETFDSNLVFAYFMLFVVVFPMIGAAFWLFISLFFATTSIFIFFEDIIFWLLTTKKERENNPYK